MFLLELTFNSFANPTYNLALFKKGRVNSVSSGFKKSDRNLQFIVAKIVQYYLDVNPEYNDNLSDCFTFLKVALLKDRNIDVIIKEESHQTVYKIVIDKLKLQKNLVFNKFDETECVDLIMHFTKRRTKN